MNLKTGAMGLNITSANIGIINDFDWVPGNMIQAEDRLWRIGQKREVNIKYPIYSDTIEEVIYEIINEKMNNISIAIEGKEGEYFSKLDKEKETKTVFELIKEKYKKI